LKINVAPFFKEVWGGAETGQAGYNLLLKVSAPLQDPQKLDNKKAGLIRLIFLIKISLKKTERGCQEGIIYTVVNPLKRNLRWY